MDLCGHIVNIDGLIAEINILALVDGQHQALLVISLTFGLGTATSMPDCSTGA